MTKMNWDRARQESLLSKHGADPVPEPHQVIVGPSPHPKKKARRRRSRNRVPGRCRICRQEVKDLRAHFASNHPNEPIELPSAVHPSSVLRGAQLASLAANPVPPPKPGSPACRWIDQHGNVRCSKCGSFFSQSQLREHLRSSHATTPEAAYAFIRHDQIVWLCVTSGPSD